MTNQGKVEKRRKYAKLLQYGICYNKATLLQILKASFGSRYILVFYKVL
jgi:hypothetical protein